MIIPADVGNIGSRIAIQFLCNHCKVDIRCKLHFSQIDLKELLSSLG